MSIGKDKTRARSLAEREELLDRLNDPVLYEGFDINTRQRILSWIENSFLSRGSDLLADFKARTGLSYKTVAELFSRTDGALFATAIELVAVHAYGTAALSDRAYGSRGHVQAFMNRLEELDVLLGDLKVGFRFFKRAKCQWPMGVEMDRVDSPILHQEIIERAFELTSHADFQSANRHYAKARADYSSGAFEDAITNAGKALESSEKVLVRKLDPSIDAGELDRMTAAPLGQLIIEKGVLPNRLQTVEAQVRTLLSQGPTTVRNQTAHGGEKLRSPEAALASLIINLCGSLIVFLVDAHDRS